MSNLDDTEYVLEELKPEDAERCAEVLFKSLKGTLPPAIKGKEGVLRMIWGPMKVSVIAKKGNEIAGIITGTTSLPPSIIFIHVLSREASMAGLEKMLLEHFSKVIKEKVPGANYLTTSVPADERFFISFYLNLGFTIYGFVREGYLGKDVVMLRRSIEG